jgi:hypothetical protein
MRTIGVNENNDIYLGPDGNFVVLTGKDAIAQSCKQAAQTLKGEMIFQINQGLPDFQTVWDGEPNVPQFEAALRQELLNVPGVTGIKDLSAAVRDGILYYTVEILTDTGEIEVINGGL